MSHKPQILIEKKKNKLKNRILIKVKVFFFNFDSPVMSKNKVVSRYIYRERIGFFFHND